MISGRSHCYTTGSPDPGDYAEQRQGNERSCSGGDSQPSNGVVYFRGVGNVDRTQVRFHSGRLNVDAAK